jgi:hypothetical protein
MKWINESNVEFNCGNHALCIFKFDNSRVWFMFDALCSTQTVRTEARKLGQAYGAKEVTIKYLWDGGKGTEPRENVVDFYCYAGKYYFRIPLLAQGWERCEFKNFEDSELFV